MSFQSSKFSSFLTFSRAINAGKGHFSNPFLKETKPELLHGRDCITLKKSMKTGPFHSPARYLFFELQFPALNLKYRYKENCLYEYFSQGECYKENIVIWNLWDVFTMNT
jgi:hypothetical protein